MRIPLLIALPMPLDEYRADFTQPGSQEEFDRLFGEGEVLQLPLAERNSPQMISQPGPSRDRQYAQAGVYICAHCHVLLALWDGKPSDKLGGTAQVVRFHHDDIMPGFTEGGRSSQQILADDESDLVYHIVCSRNRSDAPHPPKGAPSTAAVSANPVLTQPEEERASPPTPFLSCCYSGGSWLPGADSNHRPSD